MADVITRLQVQVDEVVKQLDRLENEYKETANNINEVKKAQAVQTKERVAGVKTEIKSLDQLKRAQLEQKEIIKEIEREQRRLQKLQAKGGKDYSKQLQRVKSDLVQAKREQQGFTEQIKRSTQAQKRQAAQTDKLSIGIKKLGGVIAAAFAVRRIVQFAKESGRLFDIQAQAESQLLVALKGREDVQQSLIAQAKELQTQTLFGDEETIQAQALIAAFTKEEDQIKALTVATQDFATAKKFDLRAAAELVTKTFASTTNSLTRYGIEVEGAAGSAERLESVTNAINKAFGGQAKQAAQVGTGAINQLQSEYRDIREEIGERLVGAINLFLGGISKQSEAIEQERSNLNALVSQLILANEQREDTSDLISQIQLQYPDFLKNIDTEVLSETELRDRLKEVNAEYLQRATVLGLQEEIEAAAAKLSGRKIKALKLEADALSFASKTAAKFGLENEIVGMTLEDQLKFLKKNISETRKGRAAIEDLTGKYNRFAAVSRRAARAEEDYNEILELNTKLIEKNGGAVEESNEGQEDSEEALVKTIADIRQANKELNEELNKKSITDQAGIQNILRQIKANEDLIRQLTTLEEIQKSFTERLKGGNLSITDIIVGDLNNDLITQTFLSLAEGLDGIKISAEDVADSIVKGFDEIPKAVKLSRDFIDEQAEGILETNEKLSDAELQAIDQSAKAVSSFLGDSKEAAIAQVLLANAVTLANAASSVKSGEPITYIALLTAILGTVGGITAAIRKDAESVKVPQFAEGISYLHGPGTTTSDSIPARLSRGERVVKASDNAAYWDELESITKGNFNQKYIKKDVVMNVLKKTEDNKNKTFADNLANSLILNNLDNHNDLYDLRKKGGYTNYLLELLVTNSIKRK